MNKVLIRGSILLSIFFGSWLLLQQIDWVRLLNADFRDKSEYLQDMESKLGEMMYDDFARTNLQIDDSLSVAVLDTLVAKICQANHIDPRSLKVYLFENEEVNAFAIPDRQLLVYSGLIEKADTAEALCGVLAHEIAHIQKGHVMQSLKREIGLSILFSVITGNSDITVMREIGKLLSSRAFNREMEREADLTGLEYLQKAHIDPEPFAEFMGIIDDDDPVPAFQWMSTHPLPKERKQYLLRQIKKRGAHYSPVLSQELWKDFKAFFEG
mgnify:FL=1